MGLSQPNHYHAFWEEAALVGETHKTTCQATWEVQSFHDDIKQNKMEAEQNG